MAMASMDPYRDFRTSMDEMVEAHDLKDWSALQELLQCYLRLNQKSTHSFIFEAFVDLIVHLASQGKIQRSSCSVAPPLAPLHPTPCFGHCP
ncbi:unnamed protein product [Spirodela intermedia]|nr:unnamed protein product [Spirodela intermedia]CAA6656469.1 unnamed protein product [Spirodela intermedia]